MRRKIEWLLPKIIILLLLAGGATAFISFCARDSAPSLPDDTIIADHVVVAQVKRPEWKPSFYCAVQTNAETAGLTLTGRRADSFAEAPKGRAASRARLTWIQAFRI